MSEKRRSGRRWALKRWGAPGFWPLKEPCRRRNCGLAREDELPLDLHVDKPEVHLIKSPTSHNDTARVDSDTVILTGHWATTDDMIADLIAGGLILAFGVLVLLMWSFQP